MITTNETKLLDIIKVQQRLLEELVNPWNPDVQKNLAIIQEMIEQLHNYKEDDDV